MHGKRLAGGVDRDDLHLAARHLGRRSGELADAVDVTLFDAEIPTLDVAEVAQALPEASRHGVDRWAGAGRETGDAADLWRRLPRQRRDPTTGDQTQTGDGQAAPQE